MSEQSPPCGVHLNGRIPLANALPREAASFLEETVLSNSERIIT
jgi:hypothetical protein